MTPPSAASTTSRETPLLIATCLKDLAPWRLDCGYVDPLPAARRPVVALVATAWPADRDGLLCSIVPARSPRGWRLVLSSILSRQVSKFVDRIAAVSVVLGSAAVAAAWLLHPLAAQAPGQKPYSRPVSGLLRRELRR